MSTDGPFVLLDEQSGSNRLYTGLLSVDAATSPGKLPTPAHPAVLLADYEGRSRLAQWRHCDTLSDAEVDELLSSSGDATLTTPRPDISFDEFRAAIGRIHTYIRDGHTYQVNFSFRLRTTVTGDPRALYRRLRAAQPVEFGALARLDDEWILSRSPELFVRREGDRLTTRPMKGTASRGRTPAEDDANTAWLRTDPKTRSENLMIVDLLRNDLGRVAAPGTVEVTSLFATERYPTLWQLTSTIRATAERGATTGDVLDALFPCGSITGAPKQRTMQIIDQLESSPRGLYTGAIGWIEPGGDFTLSVAIRTLVLTSSSSGEFIGTLGVGAGIVLDSDARAEWDECLLKAAFLDPLRTQKRT